MTRNDLLARKLWPLWVLLLLLGIAVSGRAQTVVETDSVVVAWDAVATLEDGRPVPGGDIVSYEVYRTAFPIQRPGDPAAHISQGVTTATTMTVTFPDEGEFAVGVRTLRLIGGSTGNVEASTINWSSVNGAETPNPFIVRRRFRPATPSNLRVP